jgi:hypothetical protein
MTPEQLEKFTGVDDYREYLSAPWRRDGFIYATNGHFMVEIPDDGRAGIPPYDKHPDCAALFAKRAPGEFKSLPALGKFAPCESCGGKGVGYRETCPDCDGEGEFKHGCYEYDCKRCDGEGYFFFAETPAGEKESRCPACYGLGEAVDRNHGTPFGTQVFATRLLRVIATLPGVEAASCSGDKPPLWFRFDGGRGLVMPLNV